MIATEPPGNFQIEIKGQLVDPLSVKRRLTCILAADAVGYSSHMGEDEEGTIRVLSAHRAVIDGIIAFHGGRIISTAGDSVLAEFSSVVEAVRCAVEIQEALKTRNDSLPERSQMLFRVGVNLGDVVVKDNDLLGDGVNVAARLEAIAEPGGICISSSVYDQITGKLDLGFQDIGDQSLKNISRPIHAYRVSGTAGPGRPVQIVRLATPKPKPNRIPWGIGMVGAAAIAAVVAWQTGWVRFGAGESVVKPVPVIAAPAPGNAPAAAAVDANAKSTQGEADRLRAEAETLKRQAEAELARVRIDADASRATRQKVDSEAAAARIRAQAEADAARIRSEAEAIAARTKTEAEAQTAKTAPAVRKADAKAAEVAAVSAALSPGVGKATPAVAGATGSAARFDGAWSVAIVCASTPDGAQGYRIEFGAQVKDGLLRGDRGVEGTSGWLRLEGPIQPDGSATFDARGLTDNPKYTINGVAKGSPVGYHVAARFEGSSGNGKRVELRACDVHFAKQ